MKILTIKATGYKMLEDNFYINFLTKTRVLETDLEDEVLELDELLYYPTSIVFTGKNSSGKSTILNLIEMCYRLLNSGRIKYEENIFSDSKIFLEFSFFLNSIVYKYSSEIIKPNLNAIDNSELYCEFQNETLFEHKYSKKYAKRILRENFTPVSINKSNIHDTSILYNITKNYFYSFFFSEESKRNYLEFFLINLKSDLKLKSNLISLFDDSIEKLEISEDEEKFVFKRIGTNEKNVTKKYLLNTLSEGTLKGLFLFSLSKLILENGATLIIDEIENSYHKNVVESLILLFNDKRINKHKANLIFSTHYAEILDIFRRNDNIFVMERNENIITCKNLYEDYENDPSLVKSNLYNKNTFNTLLDYETLMKVKRELINEIFNND